MRVWLDTSPLESGHAHRGIGAYTRFLLRAFEELIAKKKLDGVELLTSEPEVAPDIIHYPFFDLFFSTLTVPKVTPVIVTIHDVIPLVFPEKYRPGVRGTLRFWKQKRALQRVAGVITDSEVSRQDIHEHLAVPLEKIWAIPLAANPEIEPVSEYYQQKYAQQVGAPEDYIVYVGDINYNKNLPTLLLALTQLPEEVHLCVVSRTFRNTDIPEGQQLAKIITENDLEDRVHILDIPSDQPEILSGVLGGARCLVQPSLYEGFGLPVLEAMQAGTVVVSTNGGSLPEVAGEAAIVVEPTLVGLTDGIREAWKLRGEDRESRIQAGLKWAAKFSWSDTAKQTASVYQFVHEQHQRVLAEKAALIAARSKTQSSKNGNNPSSESQT